MGKIIDDLREAVNSLSEMKKINQKDYKFYVVNPENLKIESGWEDREDAKDQANQWKEDGVKTKILTFKGLMQKGVDPNDNKNWANLTI